MSDDTLSHDGAAWEALERAVGHDPDALPYPPDIAARIEALDLRGAILSNEECDRPDACDCCGGAS